MPAHTDPALEQLTFRLDCPSRTAISNSTARTPSRPPFVAKEPMLALDHAVADPGSHRSSGILRFPAIDRDPAEEPDSCAKHPLCRFAVPCEVCVHVPEAVAAKLTALMRTMSDDEMAHFSGCYEDEP